MNISFMLTPEQIVAGTKTVTRRLGWKKLKVGQILVPVHKCQGLRQGEHPQRLREDIRVVSVRREPLRRMIDDFDYGFEECVKEGFGNDPEKRWPGTFVNFFCMTHDCEPETEVTRIEFEYL